MSAQTFSSQFAIWGEAVAADLRQTLKAPGKGRNGMSAEQVLRSLVLKQIESWPFRELRERIADGITLRELTRFGVASVPGFKAFHRASSMLTPKTQQTLNELVGDVALALGVEDVRKVRMDTTVSETNRELLYTAVTRARSSVTVHGSPETIAAAVRQRIVRSSGLRDALWGRS